MRPATLNLRLTRGMSMSGGVVRGVVTASAMQRTAQCADNFGCWRCQVQVQPSQLPKAKGRPPGCFVLQAK
jgi:hypothetical protein